MKRPTQYIIYHAEPFTWRQWAIVVALAAILMGGFYLDGKMDTQEAMKEMQEAYR